MNLPTQADEDWRYVDCRPLAQPASEAVTPLPGESVAAEAFPAPLDATHAWATAGRRSALRITGSAELGVDDAGGDWALHLDVAPGATLRLTVRRLPAAGRSASWLHLALGRGAVVEIEDLPTAAGGVRLAACSAELGRDTRLDLRIAQLGGELVRHRADLRLAEAGAELAIDAASAPRGDGQAHLLTRVVHAVGPTMSRQLAKAVLRDRARTSFDGVVGMLAGADGCRAEQQNRNLLLSPLARADTRPQLDIRADEVEASHGATVGAMDPEERLYLRARGLSAAAADELLTAAFLDEALLAFRDPAARERLHAV
jgi:Fe-S cluster assembly protein SufD